LPFHAHPVEQHRVGVAVGDQAMFLLLGADEVPHPEIEVRGEPLLVVAQFSRPLLQRDPVVAWNLRAVRRPRRADRAAALLAAGQPGLNAARDVPSARAELKCIQICLGSAPSGSDLSHSTGVVAKFCERSVLSETQRHSRDLLFLRSDRNRLPCSFC
jgi:hypothetical protein